MKLFPAPLRRRYDTTCRTRAFTLVELLVSMSVLLLLLVITMQMIKSVQSLTTGSSRRLDADSQARQIFDRMAIDFAQIVKRQDVDYFFQKSGVNSSFGSFNTNGNDQMAFYSETTGYYPTNFSGPVPKSNAALVGYRIYEATQAAGGSDILPRLERLNKALMWNGVTALTSGVTPSPAPNPSPRAMAFLTQTLPVTWPAVFSGSASNMAGSPDMLEGIDNDYQVIGETVFRMEICFLVKDSTGTLMMTDTPYLPYPSPTPAAGAATNYSTAVTPYAYNGLRDVVAVVVTLAILDNTSRLTIQHTDLAFAANKLLDSNTGSLAVPQASPTPNPSPTPSIRTTPAAAWQVLVNNGSLIKTSGGQGLTPTAAAQVRVYERYFYLGNAQ